MIFLDRYDCSSIGISPTLRQPQLATGIIQSLLIRILKNHMTRYIKDDGFKYPPIGRIDCEDHYLPTVEISARYFGYEEIDGEKSLQLHKWIGQVQSLSFYWTRKHHSLHYRMFCYC